MRRAAARASLPISDAAAWELASAVRLLAWTRQRVLSAVSLQKLEDAERLTQELRAEHRRELDELRQLIGCREGPVADEKRAAELDAPAAEEPAERLEGKETCQLAESMWDCSLLYFRTDLAVGRVITLWALLVLLLNMLLQTTIAVIVVLKMGEPGYIARFIKDLWCASEPRFAAV